MDSYQLKTLISQGENEQTDFKRQLDLQSSSGKAEFIKDVIAIANSSTDKGYLLVGVEDNGQVIGVERLEEEQIQQIAATYVTPPVSLHCSLVATEDAQQTPVGVIRIKATTKPCKLARSLDRLLQNDVFVRHGSVVMKASPEEIIFLASESRFQLEVRPLIQAAETHIRIGDYSAAISAYSKAIEIAPSAELYLARGNAKEKLLDETKAALNVQRVTTYNFEKDTKLSALHHQYQELRQHVSSDYGTSLLLNPDISQEKQARLGRLRIDNKDEDYQWLLEGSSGQELGEVLYWHVYRCVMSESDCDNKLGLLTQAINLGVNNHAAFYLRAQLHYFDSNYGLALGDIKQALSMVSRADNPVYYEAYAYTQLCIMVAMGNISDAYDFFKTVSFVYPGPSEYTDHWVFLPSLVRYDADADLIRLGLIINRLQNISFNWRLKQTCRTAVLMLADHLRQSNRSAIPIENKYAAQLRTLIHSARSIVGEEFWQQHTDELETLQ